ncbi:hypothetical protein EOA23_27860 [Mesorhizobium sp. M2A.F.Ca.ET.042.01.1.1]|uniref:hypothetical protein n=1 Tax=Mesorhizobium sp. M2A.F.Ca.ET.042.01.1.1 TaxID=2496745 RepID=UPI000FC9DAF5|nr:hypothetical protein [Mesorhizobium sp. M2A.F.Ca.ET.042.01.1.1]RUX20659.1 hypothetical protein EOA23_27860 [Mesorhizobium sp. M2A.F.Ca.ET.042.01.1.1]
MQDILASAFDAAVAFARSWNYALPESMTVEAELAAVDAISASANQLAEAILAGSSDRAARAKAEAWLDGSLEGLDRNFGKVRAVANLSLGALN